MKAGLSEIICVVDRSGSMETIVNDAIGSFNDFLAEQKKHPGECRFSLTLFNTRYEIRHNGVPLQDVENFTPQTYRPSGMTALLDAVGRTIDEVGERLAKTPEEERPERVVFVIMTDGMENASKEYNREQIHKKIKRQTDEYKWEFVFLAAGEDAFAEAQGMGIKDGSVMRYAAFDAQSHAQSVTSLSENVARYRSGAPADWAKKGKTQ